VFFKLTFNKKDEKNLIQRIILMRDCWDGFEMDLFMLFCMLLCDN
jgi:hypothetical protein